jgi:hypothetical protein
MLRRLLCFQTCSFYACQGGISEGPRRLRGLSGPNDGEQTMQVRHSVQGSTPPQGTLNEHVWVESTCGRTTLLSCLPLPSGDKVKWRRLLKTFI